MPPAFTSYADAGFWEYYHALPKDVQKAADKAFALFDTDPKHPSLHFKKVGKRQPVYSARVTQNYRALCYMIEDQVYWFWIGDHKAYDKLIRSV